jgi:ABC-2 type transport system permease protein
LGLLPASPPTRRSFSWRVKQRDATVHFLSFAQAILYRGAGLAIVWPEFVIVALIGVLFLGLALLRFRKVTVNAVT